MKRLAIAAVGLALVVGIVVGGTVGNLFGRSASASTAAVGGRLISLGTVNVPGDSIYEFPMVDVRDCADLFAMFQGDGPQIPSSWWSSPDGINTVGGVPANMIAGLASVSATFAGRPPYIQPRVHNGMVYADDITGWLWCVTSPSYAVGGFADMPAVAGPSGTPGMGGATYAVLAGAAAGALAFAVLATLSVKRWRVG